MSPLSQSLTYTAAVMCIADTRTIPSFTPLVFTTEATSSVMRMNSCRFFVLNQRYSVAVVIRLTNHHIFADLAPGYLATWRLHNQATRPAATPPPQHPA